jgi:hypothetical protein
MELLNFNLLYHRKFFLLNLAGLQVFDHIQIKPGRDGLIVDGDQIPRVLAAAELDVLVGEPARVEAGSGGKPVNPFLEFPASFPQKIVFYLSEILPALFV